MSKHHVKLNQWFDGMLQTIHHEFESLKDAMDFATSSNVSHVKVYDNNNTLVHSAQNVQTPSVADNTTYA
jgi:hypothetical protein